MSATDQALDHARVAERMKDFAQRDFWAKEAVRFLFQEGPPLPPSTVQAWGAGFRFTCSVCKKGDQAPDVAGLMDIAEQHEGCGGAFKVWHCPTCSHVEFSSHAVCRTCGKDKPANAIQVETCNPRVVTDQRATYYVEDRSTTISCGSLLRAQRAARAMFPGQKLRIRMAFLPMIWGEQGRREI